MKAFLQLAKQIARPWRGVGRRPMARRPMARRTMGQNRRSGQAGFTLIELLVVMLILVLLASVIGPRVLGYVSSSRTKTASLQIEALSSALEFYKLDNGRYPSTSEGLSALVKAPTGAKSWNGPYLRKAKIPRDPWGNAYDYAAPGRNGPFDLRSFGADGREGGADENADVTNW